MWKKISIVTLLVFCLLLFVRQTVDPFKSNTEKQSEGSPGKLNRKKPEKADCTVVDTSGKTVEKRFAVPAGYERVEAGQNSFTHYLRNLALKKHGSPVLMYDGSLKVYQGAQEAVVDMDIGKKDLQQCADAVMRLRAEYLYAQKKYTSIHFNLTNGFRVDYSKWMEGYRVAVKGNSTSWVKSEQPSNTYRDFRNYLEFVFSYAGSLSLSKEMEPISLNDILPGDVLIRGGSPGHAVTVMDVAIKKETGIKIFMLSQSYMPAQEIHILKNPSIPESSPWYFVSDSDNIETPEWTFTKNELKRFKD